MIRDARKIVFDYFSELDTGGTVRPEDFPEKENLPFLFSYTEITPNDDYPRGFEQWITGSAIFYRWRLYTITNGDWEFEPFHQLKQDKWRNYRVIRRARLTHRRGLRSPASVDTNGRIEAKYWACDVINLKTGIMFNNSKIGFGNYY